MPVAQSPAHRAAGARPQAGLGVGTRGAQDPDVRSLTFILCLTSAASFAQGEIVGEIVVRLLAPTVAATSAGLTGLSTELSKGSSRAREGQAAAQAECSTDSDCHSAYACRGGQCVTVSAAPTPVEAPLSPPPPPPESTLRWRGSEVFLRARVVELREELVLGRGPVIATLAGVERVDPAALARTLRAHRAELLLLIGDGADEAWASRFLHRLDALVQPA